MTDGTNGHDPADERMEPTLAELLDDLVEEFPDAERRTSPAGVDYVVDDQPFARLTGATAHFRLRPEIVAAAARTGDAAVSTLGRDWVAFSPRRLDQYALDRAQSWFELGHRLAAEGAARPERH
jgi:hypothetical protein